MLSILCVTILLWVAKHRGKERLFSQIFFHKVFGSKNENIDPIERSISPLSFLFKYLRGIRDARVLEINFYIGKCRSLLRWLQFTFETIFSWRKFDSELYFLCQSLQTVRTVSSNCTEILLEFVATAVPHAILWIQMNFTTKNVRFFILYLIYLITCIFRYCQLYIIIVFIEEYYYLNILQFNTFSNIFSNIAIYLLSLFVSLLLKAIYILHIIIFLRITPNTDYRNSVRD